MTYVESDVQGRYTLLQGTLDGKEITIMNSYGPNMDDETFYPHMQELLAIDSASTIIWAGGYNCVLDGPMDRDAVKHNTKPRMTRSLGEAVQDLALCDIWRQRHPDRRDYTCFSPTHNTYSRLDRIYTSEHITEQITVSQHLARYLSNHAPVLVDMQWGPSAVNKALWRLAPEILLDSVGRDIRVPHGIHVS